MSLRDTFKVAGLAVALASGCATTEIPKAPEAPTGPRCFVKAETPYETEVTTDTARCWKVFHDAAARGKKPELYLQYDGSGVYIAEIGAKGSLDVDFWDRDAIRAALARPTGMK